jgi:hypothetical protein
MCLPGTDRAEPSSGRKGPRFPFPRCQDRARAIFIPEGPAGPRRSWFACVGTGGQAGAPAQERRGSLSPTAARDGRDWHLVFPCHRSRPAIVIPSHADARADRAPDEVDDRVTGLSGARSGRRHVIPEDPCARAGSSCAWSPTDIGAGAGAFAPPLQTSRPRLAAADRSHATNLSCQGEDAVGAIAGAAVRRRSVAEFHGFENKSPAGE